MHFTYKEDLDKSRLMQGDILQRTPALDAVLEEVHPHFARRSDNLFFMVLSQSCDLEFRPSIGSPKTPHIAICPVRPLEYVIRKSLIPQVSVAHVSPVPVGTEKDRQRFQVFLEGLFNNNQSGLFFLQGEPGQPIASDCCAMTRLSISLKTELHFATCLAAKVVQLSDQFQAKLGWAVGNIYSRVGTDDWPQDKLKEKIQSILKQSVFFVLDERARKDLLTRAAAEAAASGTASIDEEKLIELAEALPSKKSKALDAVVSVAEKAGVDVAVSARLRNRLSNDPLFSSFFKT